MRIRFITISALLFSFSAVLCSAAAFLNSLHTKVNFIQQTPAFKVPGSALILFLSLSINGADEKVLINIGNVTNHQLRFSGVGRLYVNQGGGRQSVSPPIDEPITHLQIVDRLAAATVAVIGLGGVGSWCAEALCRSGIGSLILLDLDDVCISNTNRQIHAMSSTVGKLKIDEMKKRLIDINPKCNVTNIYDFVSEENVAQIFDRIVPELSVCVDAIDGQTQKTAIIATCCSRGVPLVTCGGSAGRIDPTQVVCDDLTKAIECRLLAACRKNLRNLYGFDKGPSFGNLKKFRPKVWRISAVYSKEQQKTIVGLEDNFYYSSRTCDGVLGTVCFVTGTYGFVAASRVVGMIANDNLLIPKKWD